jgi:hypothetical protein
LNVNGAQVLSLSIVAACLVTTMGASSLPQSQSSQTPAPPPPSSAPTVLDPPKTGTESPLVRAARQSKASQKIPKKVLTNADVKKSKGKLAVTSPRPLPVTATKPDPDKRTSLEKQDAQYRARKAAHEKLTANQKRVDGLEKDLAAIEQSYYEERDLNRRDDIIQKRYAQAKRQLEDARKELADTRDALTAHTPKE